MKRTFCSVGLVLGLVGSGLLSVGLLFALFRVGLPAPGPGLVSTYTKGHIDQ